MSFDYIHDLFGKFRRNKKTRFTDIETRAVKLIKAFVEGNISDKDFATAFDGIRSEFYEKMKIDGQITINEDTPLWLNSFLGFHFQDWYTYQQVKWIYEKRRDELPDDYKVRYENIRQMGYDERFMKTCKAVLKELK